MTTTYPLHATIDLDTGAIYGLGDSVSTARAAARAELARGAVSPSEVVDMMADVSDARITAAAADYVRDAGGAPTGALRYGRIPGTHIVAISLRSEDDES